VALPGAEQVGHLRRFYESVGWHALRPDPDCFATEDVFNTAHPNPRIASELAGAALLEAGVNVSVMRLPQVHDTVKQGLVTLACWLREEGDR